MFGNMALWGIHYPSGRWGYVGSIPTEICHLEEATTSDVLGGRAFRDEGGNLVVWKTPLFNTKEEAQQFAESKGFSPKW